MSVSSRKEIRDHILLITRQSETQIGTIVNQLINLTLAEMNDPAWAMNNNRNHWWSWLRRKNTISASAETVILPREVDKIALVRQINTPLVLKQLTDEQFYRLVPYPTATGNPEFYRQWQVEGVQTVLAADDTVNVVSSSGNDAGDTNLLISVSGYDTDGIWRTETFTLNGTTSVTGSQTFDSGRPLFVTKLKNTVGNITVSRNTGATTLVILGPTDRVPLFKVLSLYPIPSSAKTLYYEYYTTIQGLHNDSDVPLLPEKWHVVVVQGVLEKVYQYLNKEQDRIASRNVYTKLVQSMIFADAQIPDLVARLEPRQDSSLSINLTRSEDAIS